MMSRISQDVRFRFVVVGMFVALVYLFGTVVVSAQIYSDLYNFSGADGESPSYPQVMAQGQDGNLYGTVTEGLGNSGVIFKFTPGGTLIVIHTFSGTPDGSRPNAGLTLGLDGNFYG